MQPPTGSAVVTSGYAAGKTAANTQFFNGVSNQIAAAAATPMQNKVSPAMYAYLQANPSSLNGQPMPQLDTSATTGFTSSSPAQQPASSTSTTGQTPSTTGSGTSPASSNSGTVPNAPDLNNVQIDPTLQSYINHMGQLQATADSASAGLIAAIGQQFDVQIQNAQIQGNQLVGAVTTQGNVNGTARYAPSVATSAIQSTIAANMRIIGGLESDKMKAVSEAQLAQANADFDKLDKQRAAYSDAQDKQRTVLQDTYDNLVKQNQLSIAQQQNQREEKAAALDLSTKTAENFAPSILKQLNALPDQASRDNFIQQFATAHNIDPATLSGVVQKYNDNVNQSMKSAMYSMLADNPRAGISMDDINGNNIQKVAAKVAQGPDWRLKTASQQADITEKLASAAIAQAQVSMMRDPNTITSLATATLNNGGTVPASTPAYMIPVVLSAARQMAPTVLPKGAIVGTDGMPKQISQESQTQIQAGMQLYKAINDMKNLQPKIITGPGASYLYGAGELIGLTPTEVTAYQNDAGIIAQNYDVLKGGVRGGSSAALMDKAQNYVPNVDQLSQYNDADAATLQNAVIAGIRDVLGTNGVQLNNFPIMTDAEKSTLTSSITAQGKAAGYSQSDIDAALQAHGLK